MATGEWSSPRIGGFRSPLSQSTTDCRSCNKVYCCRARTKTGSPPRQPLHYSHGSRRPVFFNLRSAYQVADTVDLPEFVLTVDTGQRHKSVVDYWGEKVGMPKIVTELEEAVDKAAGTDRWLRGSTGLTAWLDGQHFDFHSPEAAQLAARADEATVLDLIDRGVPLDSEVSFPKFPPDDARGRRYQSRGERDPARAGAAVQ